MAFPTSANLSSQSDAFQLTEGRLTVVSIASIGVHTMLTKKQEIIIIVIKGTPILWYMVEFVGKCPMGENRFTSCLLHMIL